MPQAHTLSTTCSLCLISPLSVKSTMTSSHLSKFLTVFYFSIQVPPSLENLPWHRHWKSHPRLGYVLLWWTSITKTSLFIPTSYHLTLYLICHMSIYYQISLVIPWKKGTVSFPALHPQHPAQGLIHHGNLVWD